MDIGSGIPLKVCENIVSIMGNDLSPCCCLERNLLLIEDYSTSCLGFLRYHFLKISSGQSLHYSGNDAFASILYFSAEMLEGESKIRLSALVPIIVRTTEINGRVTPCR